MGEKDITLLSNAATIQVVQPLLDLPITWNPLYCPLFKTFSK